jgi:hypothetical protein
VCWGRRSGWCRRRRAGGAGPHDDQPGAVLADRLDVVEPVQAGHPADRDLGHLGPHPHRRTPAQQLRQHPPAVRGGCEPAGGARGDVPVEEAGRQHQHVAGEPVAAEVGGLPDPPGRGVGERLRDRAAERGAAHVLAAMGADAEHGFVDPRAEAAGSVRDGGEVEVGQLAQVADLQPLQPAGPRMGAADEHRAPARAPVAAVGAADQQRAQAVPAAQLGQLASPGRGQGGGEDAVGDVARPRLRVLDQQPGPHRGGGALRRLAQRAGHGGAAGRGDCGGRRARHGGHGVRLACPNLLGQAGLADSPEPPSRLTNRPGINEPPRRDEPPRR